MTTIQQTIASLDDMRGKATQGEWRIDDEDGNLICNDDVLSVDMRQSDINYIADLHNDYPTLRNAALEAERYKRAREALERDVTQFCNPRCTCKGIDVKCIHLLLNEAIVDYRQAVEQKEV